MSQSIDKPRLAILASFSGDGGMEMLIANLFCELLRQDINVNLLLIRARGGHVQRLPESNRIRKLGPNSSWLCIPALTRYLRTQRPAVLFAAKHRAVIAAIVARYMSGQRNTRVVALIGSDKTTYLRGKSRPGRYLWYVTMRFFYPRTDLIITMSQGLLEHIHSVSGTPRERIKVVPTPVIPTDINERTRQPVNHPWLTGGDIPVIIGAGRFSPEKGFETLIRAFADLRRQRECRLILLGRGELQDRYTVLAKELGIADDIDFPGFVDNHYAYLARASIFVLSSSHEGAPNVIIDSLACGTPVVATDCPSGPREILQDGKLGILVSVGDVEGLAAAMANTLDNPPSHEYLRTGVAQYTAEASAHAYLTTMRLA